MARSRDTFGLRQDMCAHTDSIVVLCMATSQSLQGSVQKRQASTIARSAKNESGLATFSPNARLGLIINLHLSAIMMHGIGPGMYIFFCVCEEANEQERTMRCIKMTQGDLVAGSGLEGRTQVLTANREISYEAIP